jgi:hypothetical protein
MAKSNKIEHDVFSHKKAIIAKKKISEKKIAELEEVELEEIDLLEEIDPTIIKKLNKCIAKN